MVSAENTKDVATFEDMSGARYFTAEAVATPKVLTIKSFQEENVAPEESGKEDFKWAVFFAEDNRGVVINKTRRGQLIELFGAPKNAVGKKVKLAKGTTKFAGKTVGCIDILPA